MDESLELVTDTDNDSGSAGALVTGFIVGTVGTALVMGSTRLYGRFMKWRGKSEAEAQQEVIEAEVEKKTTSKKK